MVRRFSVVLMLAALAAFQTGCGLLCCGPCGLFGPPSGHEWCGFDACGECYSGDWWGECDPCDDCGHWQGESCCHGGHSGHDHDVVDEPEYEMVEEEVVAARERPAIVKPKPKPEPKHEPEFIAPKKEPIHAKKPAANGSDSHSATKGKTEAAKPAEADHAKDAATGTHGESDADDAGHAKKDEAGHLEDESGHDEAAHKNEPGHLEGDE
jgi:hypothetical protein